MREQFEERMRWHRRLVETGGYADDLVNGARLDTQRRAEIDRLDTALKARDAEVQALREALERLSDGYWRLAEEAKPHLDTAPGVDLIAETTALLRGEAVSEDEW